jgi:hypothetical protein
LLLVGRKLEDDIQSNDAEYALRGKMNLAEDQSAASLGEKFPEQQHLSDTGRGHDLGPRAVDHQMRIILLRHPIAE